MANTLKFSRNGAVGFIDWLGVLFIAELLMHRKSAEKKPSAFDAFLAIELKALAVEEWPGGKTGDGCDSLDVDCTQCRFDALVEARGNTATGKRGVSEKKVEVAVGCVGSEAHENAARLGYNSVKMR